MLAPGPTPTELPDSGRSVPILPNRRATAIELGLLGVVGGAGLLVWATPRGQGIQKAVWFLMLVGRILPAEFPFLVPRNQRWDLLVLARIVARMIAVALYSGFLCGLVGFGLGNFRD